MQKIIQLIEDLKKSDIRKVIGQRMKEFEEMGKKSDNEIFKELCFCFLTANFSAHGGIKIQNAVGDGFLHLNEKELSGLLAKNGHRFPNARAKFIAESQKHKDNIKQILGAFSEDKNARNWLADNIKGLGMKEASHFLRNIGRKNVAIIDFHIVDLLVRNKLIEKSKTITKKKYLEIEALLKDLADEVGMPLGELDLYLWYKETGKVLK